MNCPKCLKELGPMVLDNVRLEFCVGCRGLWFEEEEISFMTELTNDFPNPQSARSEGKMTRFPCPHCKKKLEEIHFSPPHRVLLDRCLSCHGVWLDRGELKKVEETAAGFGCTRSKIIRAAQMADPAQHAPERPRVPFGFSSGRKPGQPLSPPLPVHY
jgi:Zn-finger nucleic acid-binding protein